MKFEDFLEYLGSTSFKNCAKFGCIVKYSLGDINITLNLS